MIQSGTGFHPVTCVANAINSNLMAQDFILLSEVTNKSN